MAHTCTVVARNPATSSENRIHSDETARRYGFRGGLVPGVTVYGYIVTGLLDDWKAGEAWGATGTASVRFRSPCYDGHPLEISYNSDEDGAMTVEVSHADQLCVTARAAVPAGVEAPPGRRIPWPAGPAPGADARPPASPETLAAGTVLGSIPLAADPDATTAYLDKIGAPHLAARPAIHPGMLLEGANWILSANVVLPPWIHASSGIRHHRAIDVGEPVEVAARVEREWRHERGHRFVELDVAWTVGPEVVATGRHVAIWQLAGTA